VVICQLRLYGGDRRGKVQFSELQKPRDLDLDLGSGHTAYRRASFIDFYLYTPNFVEIGKTFCGRADVRADGRTDVLTDGHFRPPLMLLGRLGGVDLIIAKLLKKWAICILAAQWLSITFCSACLKIHKWHFSYSPHTILCSKSSTITVITRSLAARYHAHVLMFPAAT